MPGTRRRARFGRSTAVFAPGLGLALALAVSLGGCDHLTALLEEKAQEVAEVVTFLAGEGAGYVTGQTIAVDGGMTMQ